MLVAIRDAIALSLKAKFFVKLVKLNCDIQSIYVFRNDDEKFREKFQGNEIYLATSISGIVGYFLFNFFMKNPKDLIEGIIRRLFRRKSAAPARNSDFINVLSQSLYQFFARSARSNRLFVFLKKLDHPKMFLIDEFFSLNVINLNFLRSLGPIIYLSSDLAYDFYADNIVASKIMYKFERDKISLPDLIISCSQRDRFKYLEMGARNVIYYPNIYPLEEFKPTRKNKIPTISIVMRGHWGSKIQKSMDDVFKALGYINRLIRVYVIGVKPKKIPKNVDLHYYDFIPSRLEYLRTLSASWIGINLGVHAGGSNQRKYDYAMAELVVFSDSYGVRGDLLPHEYAYIDAQDLAAKIAQILELGESKIFQFGEENRNHSLRMANRKKDELLRVINNLSYIKKCACS